MILQVVGGQWIEYLTPIFQFFASGGQGVLLKNHPLDPRKTFYKKTFFLGQEYCALPLPAANCVPFM
jgi:hypothetical protein